jgi:DNA-binding NarL/FixJ family response regulator
MSVRVLLADDDALMRAGISVVLSTDPGLQLVGEASDGLGAVELCAETLPDVVLMDVRMPGIDGIEATRRIVAAGHPARVLVLTTFHDDDYVWGALRAGASGFLLKRATPERLLEALHTVARGEALLDPMVTRNLVRRFLGSDGDVAGTPATNHVLARLTGREREVLTLVAEGRSNAEIADVLTIAESTAKTHVKRILAKVEARDRAQAVVFAYRSGLLRPR